MEGGGGGVRKREAGGRGVCTHALAAWFFFPLSFSLPPFPPKKLTTSIVYLGAISVRHWRAKGVMATWATTTARNTDSARMRSAKFLICFTPTFGSSAVPLKKTKAWSVGSSCFGARMVRSSRAGASPHRSRKASRVVLRSS